VIVTIDVPDQLVTDTIITALEGGINYWCRSAERGSADRLNITFFENEGPHPGTRHAFVASDWPRILATMATKAPRHFANLVGDYGDAVTADVLVQIACFGEIKYG